MPSNEEMLERLKDNMAKELAKYTFSFNQPAQEQYERFKQEMEAMLKHLYGDDMRLSPEQQELFKAAVLENQLRQLQEESSSKPKDESWRDQFVLRCSIQMDSEGRLSIKFKE